MEEFSGSFKQVYARRARRAEEWRRRKRVPADEKTEKQLYTALPAPTKKPHNKLLFADNRQGPLADSTLGLKAWLVTRTCKTAIIEYHRIPHVFDT